MAELNDDISFRASPFTRDAHHRSRLHDMLLLLCRCCAQFKHGWCIRWCDACMVLAMSQSFSSIIARNAFKL